MFLRTQGPFREGTPCYNSLPDSGGQITSHSQIQESFLRLGGHTNLKKTLFIDSVFFRGFLVSKKGGGSAQGMVVTGVWSLKRNYSLIKEDIL